MASAEVAAERREGLVVALFQLFIEGAKQAMAGNKQQVGEGWVQGWLQGWLLVAAGGPAPSSSEWLQPARLSPLQALANNLLARAVQLSRHEAVGPAATVCCSLAVTELQLQQAAAMLAKGGPMRSLAAALLDSSAQQLAAPDLQAAAAGSEAHTAALREARTQVCAGRWRYVVESCSESCGSWVVKPRTNAAPPLPPGADAVVQGALGDRRRAGP